ncbi:MAG: hypothetical protein EHM39_13380, partial [Chloroflexi bacterium]
GDDDNRRDLGEADPRGPIGEAVEMALASLATYVFESGSLDAGGTFAIQGIELQRQGEYAAAAGVYDRAISNHLRHHAVYFNLGVMQLELEDWKHAIKSFEKAAEDRALAAGAMHGMSLAYATMKNYREAAQHLIMTLRLVDLGLAMSPEEAGQLAATYNQLSASINQADESQLRMMNERFLELLTGPSWKQRVAKTRRQLEEAVRQEDPESLISIVPYINDRITEGLNLVDQYVRRGLYNLAMDHAHFMLESAPDYLPIHQRIGQILLERDNVAAAMTKYNLVANVYVARGDEQRGAEILQEALKIAPMDIGLHKSLIGLLEKSENWEQVLHQQIDMADTYYQLADYDEARTTYSGALQLAQRINVPKETIIQILHRVGDIDVSRLDLRQAMRTYEQIRKLEQEDKRARRALVDLNYKLNDTVSAIRELDGLLRLYAKQRRANKIIQILDEHVTRYPNDMALRSRLAAVYQQTGMRDKSIEQLDHLAELQLQSGLHGDALVTIRRIVGMNPPNVQDYQ